MVKQYCKKLNCTQAQLAKRLDLSLAAIGKWQERGEIPKSTKNHIELLIENEELKKELREIKNALKFLKTCAL